MWKRIWGDDGHGLKHVIGRTFFRQPSAKTVRAEDAKNLALEAKQRAEQDTIRAQQETIRVQSELLKRSA